MCIAYVGHTHPNSCLSLLYPLIIFLFLNIPFYFSWFYFSFLFFLVALGLMFARQAL
jgi:hypothetical protein